jgi:hypothetical protein
MLDHATVGGGHNVARTRGKGIELGLPCSFDVGEVGVDAGCVCGQTVCELRKGDQTRSRPSRPRG